MSEPRSEPLPPDPEGLALSRAVDAIQRYRRLVIGLTLGLSGLVVAITLLQPRTYSSVTTFMPQAPQGRLSQLSGLAAQLGINVSASEPAGSPSFYAFLLQSRELLRDVVRTTYDVPADGGSRRATLIDWYDPPGHTPAEREEVAIQKLRRDLTAGTDAESGTVQLKVRSRSARLAWEVADRMMQLVSDFNLQKRQSQAAAERKFVEGRVQDAMGRLQGAENRLQGFLQDNREYRTSPQLVFQYDRLARDVSMRQQVYPSLAQAFEQARIEEVRNTPVLTLIDPPNLPGQPDRRWLLVKALLGALLGLLAGAFVALGRDWRRRTLPAPTLAEHPTDRPESSLHRATGFRAV
jgi:uncharacterized protein involved in exopolysaccharide biosynthesis